MQSYLYLSQHCAAVRTQFLCTAMNELVHTAISGTSRQASRKRTFKKSWFSFLRFLVLSLSEFLVLWLLMAKLLPLKPPHRFCVSYKTTVCIKRQLPPPKQPDFILPRYVQYRLPLLKGEKWLVYGSVGEFESSLNLPWNPSIIAVILHRKIE